MNIRSIAMYSALVLIAHVGFARAAAIVVPVTADGVNIGSIDINSTATPGTSVSGGVTQYYYQPGDILSASVTYGGITYTAGNILVAFGGGPTGSYALRSNELITGPDPNLLLQVTFATESNQGGAFAIATELNIGGTSPCCTAASSFVNLVGPGTTTFTAGFVGSPTTTVSEPWSLYLFGVGLFGLVLVRLRTRTRSAGSATDVVVG